MYPFMKFYFKHNFQHKYQRHNNLVNKKSLCLIYLQLYNYQRHNNMDTFNTIRNLTAEQINNLNQDRVSEGIGASYFFTAEQKQQCEWQIALLQSRREHLTL
jgi:hypothetical protein